MKISEIFVSIQGESTTAGLPTVFVRTFGCNLRCPYCDSRYAWEGHDYIEMTAEQVFGKITEYLPVKQVCLTGGEPFVQIKEIAILMQYLNEQGYNVSIETNGTLFMRDDGRYNHIFASAKLVPDVKGPTSDVQYTEKMLEKYLNLLPQDEVKFVVGDMRDLEFAEKVMNKYIPRELFERRHVLVSPIWSVEGKAWMKVVASWVIQRPTLRMQIQMHKVIWGASKRGV